MRHYPVRIILSVVALVIVVGALSLLAPGWLTAAAAQESDAPASSAEQPEVLQETGDLWLSSAEAPLDVLHRFSPADQPQASQLGNRPDAAEAPEALVSWRITGSALKPRQNDVSYTTSGGGGCTYATAGDATTVWNAVPDLPQGAVIDTLRMYYVDSSASNAQGWFTIYDLYGAIVNEWQVPTAGTPGNSYNDTAIIDHTVDYSIYSYLLNWRPVVLGSTMQLCGFRIFLEPPPFGLNFLPAVTNGS